MFRKWPLVEAQVPQLAGFCNRLQNLQCSHGAFHGIVVQMSDCQQESPLHALESLTAPIPVIDRLEGLLARAIAFTQEVVQGCDAHLDIGFVSWIACVILKGIEQVPHLIP